MERYIIVFGVYDCAKDEWPKKSRSKQEKGRNKMIYIEEIMKKCRTEKPPSSWVV
jgi:hypothetical protein